jgi:hypothetical protein
MSHIQLLPSAVYSNVIIPCLSRTTELGYPDCEQTVLSVAERPLCRTRAGKETVRFYYCSSYIPAPSKVFERMRKVRSTGSFLNKKYTAHNTVVTEERRDETGARLKHLLHKSLTPLAQQAQVSTTAAWRANKKLFLRPYKIRQVQGTEYGDYKRRTDFCN